VGPKLGLKAVAKRKNICPCQESNPARPARNILTTLTIIIINNNNKNGLGVDGYNIIIDLRVGLEILDWIHLVQERVQWRAVVKHWNGFSGSIIVGGFLD
jgi:hypothetical protein